VDLDWFQVVISCDYSCSRTGYLRGGGRQNPDDLARAAAKKIVVMSEDTVLQGRIFSLALAGEDTPQTLYRLLAQPPYVNQLPWSQMHFFWGDERCVSLDDPESNYGQVRRTILVKDLIPEGNVHRIGGELEPIKAAQDYALQHIIIKTSMRNSNQSIPLSQSQLCHILPGWQKLLWPHGCLTRLPMPG